MTNNIVSARPERSCPGSLALGGLTQDSLTLVPALSQAMGMGSSLTAAVRVVLMKAAARV